jgi:GAF domain-containing protein
MMRQTSGLDEKSVPRLTLHQWLEASHRVTRQIAATLELTELYPQIVRSLQESFDHYHHVHLYLLDSENGHLNLVESSGEEGRIMKEQENRVEVGMGLVGHAAATGQPVLVSDVSQDSRWLPSSLLPGIQSELAVPLVLWESKLTKEVLGVIDVQNDQVGSLTEDDLVLLEGLGDQIAIAVRNARLFKELGRRNLDLAALNAISATLSQSLLPLDELLTSTLIQVIKTMACDAGLVSLVDLQTGKMVLSAHQGLPEPLREKLKQDGLEDTLCALVFEGMDSLGIGDLTQDAPVDVSGLVAEGFVSCLGTPLVLKGEAIGTLCIFGQHSRRVTEADFNLMRAIGGQIAVAVQSARLLEETQHSLEKLQVAYQAQDQLAHTLRELSVPVIQIWEDILVLPLVGTIDPERAMRIMEDLLEGIIQYQAEIVILDVTGVPVVDTSVANYILQTVKAAGMLGAKSILVGISGRIAQTMINIGINLSEVETRSNLQAGIEYALSLVGQAIGPRGEED